MNERMIMNPRWNRTKEVVAVWLRRLSVRLDGSHLVVMAENKNGKIMAAYLVALARKKEFMAWAEDGVRAREQKRRARNVKAA